MNRNEQALIRLLEESTHPIENEQFCCGDLVSYSVQKIEENGVPRAHYITAKIIEVSCDHLGIMYYANGKVEERIVGYRDILRIPLTERMLTDNGWEQYFYGDEETTKHYRFPGSRAFEFAKSVNEPFIVGVIGMERMIFLYVHQLQQVLRLCGLKTLADNLKV